MSKPKKKKRDKPNTTVECYANAKGGTRMVDLNDLNMTRFELDRTSAFWDTIRAEATSPKTFYFSKDPDWVANLPEKAQIFYRDMFRNVQRKYPFHVIAKVMHILYEVRPAISQIHYEYGSLNVKFSNAVFYRKLAQQLFFQYDEYKEKLLDVILSPEYDQTKINEISGTIIGTSIDGGRDNPKEIAYIEYPLLRLFVERELALTGQPKNEESVSKQLFKTTFSMSEKFQNEAAGSLVAVYIKILDDYCSEVIKRQNQPFDISNSRRPIGLALPESPYYQPIINLVTMPQAELTNRYAEVVKTTACLDAATFLCGAAVFFNVQINTAFWVFLQQAATAIIYSSFDGAWMDVDDVGHTMPEAIALFNALVTKRVIHDVKKYHANSMDKEKSMQETVEKAERKSREAETKIANAEKQIKQTQRENGNLTKELQHYKDADAAGRSEISELKRQLEEALSRLQTIDDENTAPIQEDNAFPMYTTKKIVIFGGHDTWLAPMRERFPNCNFLGTNFYNFDTIRSADLVLVQTNRMPHASYNNAKNWARKYNVPFRHFDPFHPGVIPSARQMRGWINELESGEMTAAVG